MSKGTAKLFSPSLTVFFIVLFLFCLISWCVAPAVIAVLESICTIGLYIYYALRQKKQKADVSDFFQKTGFPSEAITGNRLTVPVPSIIINTKTADIMWANSAFLSIVGDENGLLELSMEDLIPDFNTDWISSSRKEYTDPVTIGKSRYRVYGDLLRAEGNDNGSSTAMLFFIDTTDLLHIQDEYDLSRLVVALILVDNYDELTSNLADRAVSSFTASLDEAITLWAAPSGGILRKLERNRYLFVFEQRVLPDYISNRFSVLDQVRDISCDSGARATLSIGIGKDGESLQQNYEFATLSIEMALSRGGDQAVLKDRYNFSFYGGRTKETERRTLIRSRVIAGSLKELIEKAPSVYITGHKNADLDAIGAAVGVNAICRKLNKPAKIIVDLQNNASHSLLDQLVKVPAYKNCFISPVDAFMTAEENSLLIVVDTNRPDQVEARSVLDHCNNVIVIDHHRRAADYIANTLLNFHEPYASSASELVTELVQNLLDREDLLEIEILSLLSGIVLDTKNFTVRTGSRTFEAAAWLRKNGADTVAVKLLFQNDLSATLNRYEILKHAEMYRENIALCALNYTSDRITAAQAADELLNIQGIECSFVFYPDGDVVFCSARSIGEANVQMILEPLGGGGNQATAGAQIHGKTVEEVSDAIKSSIDTFFDQ